MKSITLSADERLIKQAREVARSQHRALNEGFREWLEEFTRQAGRAREFDALIGRLKHVRSAGPYTRDQMNKR